MEEVQCSLIVVVVNKGFADLVMDAARASGATGGTIMTGRGTGGEKAKKFFAMNIQGKHIIYKSAAQIIRKGFK